MNESEFIPTPGTLKLGEPHPAAFRAKYYVMRRSHEDLMQLQETFSSCALSGRREAQVCSDTLNRLMTRRPVSDRYMLGLSWVILELDDERDDLECPGGRASALRAIIARINGVSDDPDLEEFGTLNIGVEADCLSIARAALGLPQDEAVYSAMLRPGATAASEACCRHTRAVLEGRAP